MSKTTQKVILANTTAFLCEVNEVLLTNTRNRKSSKITLPPLFERAFLMVHEAGLFPIENNQVTE